MSPKTPRELIIDMHENQKLIDDTYRNPDKYIGFGWTNERIRALCQQHIQTIRHRLQVEQNSGGMPKETIRSWLVQARTCSDIDVVSLIQVQLQNAVKTYILE